MHATNFQGKAAKEEELTRRVRYLSWIAVAPNKPTFGNIV